MIKTRICSFFITKYPISDSIIFEDLDSNGIPEIIFGTETGNLFIYKSTSSDFDNFILYDSF